MWEIYDALIEGIPENYITEEIICGKYSSYVRSGSGSGIAGNPNLSETRIPLLSKNLIGLSLREVAACVKSWNFMEASVGCAALNAFYNNPQIARANGVEFSDSDRVEDRVFDPFIMSQNDVKDKKVVIVGHFPYIEKLFEPICSLSIIEWEPQEGDYPMYASEYLLPQCDYVYLSSTTLVNKTLPRYLELSKNAKRITLVGRGTPLSPMLFDYGIGDLSGFIIKDKSRAYRIMAGAENGKISTTGQKVSFKKSYEVKNEF